MPRVGRAAAHHEGISAQWVRFPQTPRLVLPRCLLYVAPFALKQRKPFRLNNRFSSSCASNSNSHKQTATVLCAAQVRSLDSLALTDRRFYAASDEGERLLGKSCPNRRTYR